MLNTVSWDRTNIGENYPGITLPLTYSFIKDAYAQVYKNFLLLMGVNKKLINKNNYITHNMLGYVRGHIFYNIENWYRFLKFLPGYRYNQEFFETMLDPVERKPLESDETPLNHLDSTKIIGRFLISLIFFPILHRRFEKKFHEIYKEYTSVDIRKLDNFQLVSLFQNIEKQFFSIWSITIINDFKVMIFLGLLSKYVKKFNGESDKIMKSIYSMKKQPRSIIPLRQIIELAIYINKNNLYKKLFTSDSAYILQKLKEKNYSELNMKIQHYLNEFGERSSNELKLEEPKFKEKPEMFISLIKQYIKHTNTELNNLQTFSPKEQEYTPKNSSYIQNVLLKMLKSITVQGIYQRENYRIRRGKAFNIAREILLEIGNRMTEANDLIEKKDIFYLYKNEVFDYIQYHSLPVDIKSIIRLRKTAIDSYQTKMARKIITSGLPNDDKIIFVDEKTPITLKGKPTSRGKIQARVINMLSLDFSADYKGKILVTGATDPGWTVIFPLLKGVITEQGGLLSHASIIARELGIPCIVQVKDATQHLIDGQLIQMDSENGQITVL